MPLEKYQDFLKLNTKQLSDFLAVRGLNTSGRKVELVARAFAAVELKLDIIESSEQQLEKLRHACNELLRKLEVPDPNEIDKSKRTDDLAKWPVVTIRNILAFNLKNKEFNVDYIGKI